MARHLGDVIRQLRENAGLSLRELSRRSNVDISSISRIERHQQHLLTQENLARVAQALDTTAPDLERLAGSNDQQPLPQNWPTLEEWLARDRYLTERQRQAILAVYEAYVRR